MKKPLVLAACSLVASVIALGTHTQDAEAQQIAQINPQVMRAFATQIKGTITVPAAAATGNLAGFKCSDMIITATSKEYNTAPAGVFASPKWTRSAAATGNWAAGQCSYSIIVPHSQQFALTAGTMGPYDCAVVQIALSGTPQWQSVPKGTTKTDNMTVSSMTCVPPVP